MLAEDKRTQLDGIVQQMTRNNEPFNNIQMVVNDFKQKYDTPEAPIQTGLKVPEPPSLARGLAKSVVGTVGGILVLGSKLKGGVEKIMTGATPQQDQFVTNIQKAAEPVGTGETIGKVGGDIAQFFLPGGLEAKGVKAINEIIDTAKFAEKFGPQAGQALNKILQVVGKGAVTGASTQAVSELQTGGKAGVAPGVVGFLAGAGGKAIETFAPGLSKALAKANLRLTPTQESKLGEKATGAADFLSKNKLIGTAGMQASKLDNINAQMFKAINDSVPDLKVAKRELVDALKQIPEQFKSEPAVYNKVVSDVESAIGTLDKTNPSKEISLNDLLSGKRSYGKDAYDKAGNLMTKESKFAIQNAYYDTLSNALDKVDANIKIPSNLQKYFGGVAELPLKEFNKIYSQSITAEKFMQLAKNKSDTTFLARALGGLVGRAAMAGLGLPGELAGTVAGYEGVSRGATMARSAIGAALQSAGSTVPGTAKIGLGLTNPGSSGESPQAGELQQ